MNEMLQMKHRKITFSRKCICAGGKKVWKRENWKQHKRISESLFLKWKYPQKEDRQQID